ncbi:MAG: hypothetical protein ACI9EF_002358 [Pseudohongiellaceae bacterium]|jgi:hypothetical protein
MAETPGATSAGAKGTAAPGDLAEAPGGDSPSCLLAGTAPHRWQGDVEGTVPPPQEQPPAVAQPPRQRPSQPSPPQDAQPLRLAASEPGSTMLMPNNAARSRAAGVISVPGVNRSGLTTRPASKSASVISREMVNGSGHRARLQEALHGDGESPGDARANPPRRRLRRPHALRPPRRTPRR